MNTTITQQETTTKPDTPSIPHDETLHELEDTEIHQIGELILTFTTPENRLEIYQTTIQLLRNHHIHYDTTRQLIEDTTHNTPERGPLLTYLENTYTQGISYCLSKINMAVLSLPPE